MNNQNEKLENFIKKIYDIQHSSKKQNENHAYTLVHKTIQIAEAIADNLVSEKNNQKELETQAQNLNRLIKDIKAFKEEKPDKWMYSFTFISNFENFSKSVREIIRNRNDKKDNSETEEATSVEIINIETKNIEELQDFAIRIPSEKEQAIHKYNRTISTANRGIDLYFPAKFRILYFEKPNIDY